MKEISDNAIQEWVNSDKELSDILVEIQSKSRSIKEQAEMAFHKLSELYNVPKNPEDIDDENEESINQSSVYEQLGLLKFLGVTNADLRGQVLTAIYLLINNHRIDINDVINIKFGKHIPEGFGIGFKEKNTDVEVVFVMKGESWSDLGCTLFTKFV